MKNRYQSSFSQDTTLISKLFNLLEIVFPGAELTTLAEQARKLGAAWEDASIPFVRFDNDGSLIAHVGVLEIPMRLMGENAIVGGVHAVCTHPDYRRRGYYREIMNEVLDYCDKRYETLVLTTSNPEYYQPFGFRFIQEHSFTTSINSEGSVNETRLLNINNIDDVRLLHRLLETRAPVSNIVGIVNEKPLFLVNEATRPMYYFPDLDTIACMSIQDNELKLYDLVAPKIFPLQELVQRIPQPIQSCSIYFSPDSLNTEAQASPEMLDGDSHLMVRGTFTPESQKFMIPRSARC
ncbi:GNAT family acetyltransferase [Dulcicalothrix desertica PCC 7102]|uniref:GNAT family acetyltransferase n=1 Tax=Dulcicalothrix desertica PCC 7102 TaxID=232991 RepID=A0A3S1AHZ3_9CYAN|nr:GNAT family N-acetyltransferase [Dulcicalothrix desertica]RUT01132.1 GNAT family acetyltransferase [Dulcicalothrix desertica PCC 7102]TWH39091.1 putative N-acetyltransferase YhbS [Dulcicalothrix desertica PCC 7102]